MVEAVQVCNVINTSLFCCVHISLLHTNGQVGGLEMRTKLRMLKASPATVRGHFSHFKYLFASAISKTVLLC